MHLNDEGSEGSDAGSPAAMSPAARRQAVDHDKQVAEVYWGQGNWEGAYLRYRDAVRINAQDAEALYGLAEAEGRLGRNVSARQHYLDYIGLQKDGRKAQAARKALLHLPATDAPQPHNPFAPGPVLP